MTSALPPSLDPELIERVSSLEVRSRSIVEGLLAGRHPSPFRGGSADFAQHRPYTAGDDLRYLDWKVWAKSDRLYIREYEDETNLRAAIIVDASLSMDYGLAEQNKRTFAQLLAGSLAYLLLRQADSVGLIIPTPSGRVSLPFRQGQGHLRTILTTLLQQPLTPRIDLGEALKERFDRETGRGMVIIISDLLVEPEGLARGLASLRQRRHDVVILHVLHSDELEFPFEGTTRFEDLEGDGQVTCDPRSLRQGYQQAMQQFLGQTRARCATFGVDYRLCPTRDGVDVPIASLLRERMRG